MVDHYFAKVYQEKALCEAAQIRTRRNIKAFNHQSTVILQIASKFVSIKNHLIRKSASDAAPVLVCESREYCYSTVACS